VFCEKPPTPFFSLAKLTNPRFAKKQDWRQISTTEPEFRDRVYCAYLSVSYATKYCLHINRVMDLDSQLVKNSSGSRGVGLMCQVLLGSLKHRIDEPVLCQSGRLPRRLGPQLACLAHGQALDMDPMTPVCL
jgi:hypothetical protein